MHHSAYQNEDMKRQLETSSHVDTTIIEREFEKPTDTKKIINISSFTSPFVSHRQHKNLANQTIYMKVSTPHILEGD